MNLRLPFINILIIAFLTFCKKEDIPQGPPEGSINLSDLVTRTDYYLPFALQNNRDDIKTAIVNNEQVDFSSGSYLVFKETGFYELILTYNDPLKEQDTILFTTKNEEREASEWGIKTWIPLLFEPEYLSAEDIEIIYPRLYVDSISVPFIFYIKESGNIKPVYCQGMYHAMGDFFNIKQGVGSVNVPPAFVLPQVNFNIGGKKLNASLSKITAQAVELKGTISTPTEISANTLVRIRNNLEISTTGSLIIREGAIVLVDESVDINVSGPVTFYGTASNPVLVSCSRYDKFWGGFITRESSGTIDAEYTIFCQSGYHDTEGYFWGHAGRQALFYTENSTLTLDHCFILDNEGQIFYPLNSLLTIDNILVQRAKTGGQINTSDLFLKNSVFSDFPDDSQIFEDYDNDALYLSASDALIENSIFMYAKDDGIDSGNIEGGEITINGCRFEACFHEGAALSSGGSVVKNHTFVNCTFTNCGQGLELGFSSPNHTVLVDNCLFLNNGVGIRYGDNYTWAEVNGNVIVKNSVSLYNERDVWNMVRMNWKPKLDNMNFENTKVSKYCSQYPELEILNDL
jgi:hypothetical protein